MLTPLVMGLGSTAPSDQSLAQDIVGLLEIDSPFHPAYSRLGNHLGFDPFSLGMFLGRVKQVLPTLRQEEEGSRLTPLCNILDSSKNRPSLLNLLGSFLVGDDWHRRPYRTRQTLFETLDIAAMGVLFYKSVDAQLPIQPVINPMGYDPAFERISSTQIPGTTYRLELWPGMNEAHGGFQYDLVSSQGELVCRIGIQIGSRAVSVVQLQGGGKTFSTHHNRLKGILGDLHPFDWLLHHLAQWAKSFGFRKLIGCGYRINSSLDKHLSAGELPESRRPHFRKIYDDRFLSMGMKPHPELSDIYQIELSDWIRPKSSASAEDTLSQLMETAFLRSQKALNERANAATFAPF